MSADKMAPTYLTPRQGAVLREIKRHLTARRYSPSHREICMGLGLNSTNGVSDHLTRLCDKGVIERTDYVSRSLIITEQGEAWLRANPPPPELPPESA